MLRYLSISNLAVIDTLQIEFREGLNVLSGETGSGKSIIIDALGLLLGERATPDRIRTGTERAFIEGVFEIAGNEPLIELLSEAGIELDENGLVVRRELSSNGRSRVFLNNRTASLTLLKEIQPHLIDIHGQGDQQSLLSAETHMYLVDAFAGTTDERQNVSLAYETLSRLTKELEELRRSESERLQTLDIIEFQVSEIEQAGLVANEDLELESERTILANAERLTDLCSEAYRSIYEDENSALARLGTVQKRLNDLSELDSRFAAHVDQLISAKHVLDDTAAFLRDYADGVQASPERLRWVEDRLIEIDRLKRKYGKTVEEVLATKSSLMERRQSLLSNEEQAQQIDQSIRHSFDQYERLAGQLSEARRSAARRFERAVRKELGEIALGAGQFSIRFIEPPHSQLSERLQSSVGLSTGPMRRTGKEYVEFYFSANPGEDLKPLNAVASGGELSRLMLVLKTITAPSLFPRTLIFDEIDAGIGGKVSDAVGLRLKRLADTNQVLCVTHQSQIARYADAHFQVSKQVVKGRTITGVDELNEEGRVEELARMIGGAEVTPLARRHARELLRTM